MKNEIHNHDEYGCIRIFMYGYYYYYFHYHTRIVMKPFWWILLFVMFLFDEELIQEDQVFILKETLRAQERKIKIM